MRGHMDCPDHTGDTCARCASAGYVIAGDPKIPLPWFLSPAPMTWTMMAGNLHQLAAAAVEECRDLAVTNPAGSRTIAQVIEAGRVHQDDINTLWVARRGAIYRIHGANVSAVVERFGKKLEGYEATAKPIFRVEDMTVKLDRMTETVTPRAPRLAPVESTRIPGLYLERRGATLTFKFGSYWETWCARTGVQLGAADGAVWPSDVNAYVRSQIERLQAILPPHRRAGTMPANAEAAPTANQEAAPSQVQESHKETPLAPILSAPATPSQQEITLMVDPTNPIQLAQARETVRKMKEAIGVYALDPRRADVFGNNTNRTIEKAYRMAEAELEIAVRAVKRVVEAMGAREQELLLATASELGPDNKKKYTVDAAKGAATAAQKTDDEYIALKAALGEAEAKRDAAELAFAEAKADQRALVREAEQLRADTALVTAGIAALGMFEVPPTPASQSAAA